MRLRLTREQLKTKRREWEQEKRRAARGPRQVRWDEIPDGDEVLVAIKPDRLNEAMEALNHQGVKALRLGRLESFCGRTDHQ